MKTADKPIRDEIVAKPDRKPDMKPDNEPVKRSVKNRTRRSRLGLLREHRCCGGYYATSPINRILLWAFDRTR